LKLNIHRESGALQRVTITIDDELIRLLDEYTEECGHENRSEAVRDLVRASLARTTSGSEPHLQCVAALVYAYEPETRKLGKRLTAEYRQKADISLTRTKLDIDETSCLEVAFLRGKRSELEKFSRQITAERGVRHGQLVIVPAYKRAGKANSL
jgi:CopG family transcriptional regulator, nickel-responsive regulator